MLKKQLLLLFFILLKFFLQFSLIHPVYELHRDEYLHLDQGNHLAAGYLSVAPFTSWIAWIIQQLGASEFWVKFFPALFGALTIVVVWKAIEVLKGGIFALVLGATCVLFSALLRLNCLFQPNSFDVLAWSFLYYCLLRYCTDEKVKWIWLAALAFAIGFLNKYNIVFQLIGLLPALLFNKQRNLFLKRPFYLAMVAAFVLLLPNLYWQYQHGFPVFYHLRELTNTQLVNVSRADFLKEQLLYNLGGIIVLLPGFLSFFMHPAFRKYQVILHGFLFTMALFILLRAKGYYAMGAYPIFFAFGAVWLDKILNKRWQQFVIRPLLVLIPVAFFWLIVPIAFPIYPPEKIIANADIQKGLGMHKWEDGKEYPISQDYADMQGWKELALLVDSAYNSLPAKDNTLVFCDNYGQAGAINYYSTHPHINALSMNADYLFWFPQNAVWKNMILVKEITDTDSSRSEEKSLFDSVYVVGQIKSPYAREKGTRVYVLTGARDTASAILYRQLESRKNKLMD